MKKAIMVLENPLGYAAAEALIYDLENYGVALVAGRAASYPATGRGRARKILGNKAGELVMAQLVKILEEG